MVLLRSTSAWGGLALALMLAAACSPVFDWRELQPEGSGVVALFPCKPDRHARPIRLAGQAVTMEMLVCTAGGSTFALSFVDVGEPAAVGPALGELRELAVGNVAGTVGASQPAQVAGMTPNPQSLHLTLSGRLPDGVAVAEQVLLFTKGLRVYQASVIGATLAVEPAQLFVASLRLAP